MDEKRREEVSQIVEHFRGKSVNQNVLQEFCNLRKFQPITEGELKDYTAQVEHDEVVGKLFPLILQELQKLTYEPEFASAALRRKIEKQNDEVRVNITKLYEEHAVKYIFVQSLAEELGNFVGGKIAMAGTTAFNKALEVMLHLARTKFGGDFNMKHAADYAKEVFDKHHAEKAKENENKTEQTNTGDPA